MMKLNLHRETRLNVLALVAAMCLFDDGGILFYQYLLVQIYFFPKNHPKLSLYCQIPLILRANGKTGPAPRKSSLLMCEIANLLWCFRLYFLWEVIEYPVFVSIFKSLYPMHLIILLIYVLLVADIYASALKGKESMLGCEP